ncbi:hypothetical protein GUJ93_ZPchr0010g10248 [Zizania palustris]|uniref:Uncharacterized protein n=1 Tax=Zizania palustris TaxID=103762 RepID=A0A8J6BQ18_ZIZPA|nr:hypothetical protein GUJ93_ZPchr0010g10248 [Zizania palustris]
MEKKEDHHVLDIVGSLAQELRVELAAAGMNSSTTELVGGGDGQSASPVIVVDRVNDSTRNVDPPEYVPQFVSIGPWHRSAKLAQDDSTKVRALHDVLSAAAAAANGAPMGLDDYIAALGHLEPAARRFYVHSFCITSKEFVRMLLLDGCYILVRFGDIIPRRAAAVANGLVAPPSVERKESGGGVSRLEAVAVVRDVFYLAENQIPFFVVDKIHQLTFLDGKTPAVDAIAKYAHELLRRSQYSIATPMIVAPPARRPEPANLLHLLHMHFKPTVLASPYPKSGRGVGGRPVRRWRTATEYSSAGVTFKRRDLDDNNGDARCILDVNVDRRGGRLHVPRLNIDAETWRLLRNLMALEQHNPEAAGSHVTAYCVFMSQLACTTRDVELLSRRGIIAHGLGNHDEVAGHFANLCKGVVFDLDDPARNYLRPACQALDRRFRSRPGRWMAWLKRKYFINPWLAAGLVAAAIGLVCTVIQAVYSVLSYQRGN